MVSRANHGSSVTSVNSVAGSGVKRCFWCDKACRDTKISIQNGLRLIRIRFGLPNSELPDLKSSELGRYLNFLLLQGKKRDPVAFPRRQGKPDGEGLVSLVRLERRKRWEFAQSVSSLKRNLPTGCHQCSSSARPAWERNVFSSPPPMNPDYLAFVRQVVTSLFPAGWDRSYYSHAVSHVPNASQRQGGERGDLSWKGQREDFLNSVLNEDLVPSSLGAVYSEVPTAGKLRPLLCFDRYVDCLAPLHKTVYAHLSKFPWLLRGPPTQDRISSVAIFEHNSSVDLVNASDGLFHSVADEILRSLFFQSVSVPRSIMSLAYASLRPHVFEKDGTYVGRVSHGQMMGAYLCFPLLCLQSYCAARWAARHSGDARFLVNGDDCIISSEKPIGDYPQGFVLNESKTIRARDVVEVNSTTFLRFKGRWREIRHLRRGSFLPDWQGMMHAAAAVRWSMAWTAAFISSRIGKKWGFLPSQLGFSLQCYPAFCRQRSMTSRRTHTSLPSSPLEVRKSLVPVQLEDWDCRASEALVNHLWEHGRDGGKREIERWSPSVGQVRRTYGYKREARKDWRPTWTSRSFGTRISFAREYRTPTPNKDLRYVPEGFITTKEMEDIASLGHFFILGQDEVGNE